VQWNLGKRMKSLFCMAHELARVCVCVRVYVCVTDSKLSVGKSIVIKTENQTVYREPQCDYSFYELPMR
jgi:hypothetical protein